MEERQPLDRAIVRPEQDLLGVSDDARGLATTIRERLTPPITIGIFGQWGSGKTSFVNLVKHYLENPEPNQPAFSPYAATRFITFSAWPYRTADELWRALLLKMAGDICAITATANEPSAKPGHQRPAGLLSWLSDTLKGEIVIQPAPDKNADYMEFVELLGELPYGSVSKSASQQLQLDQQQALLLAAKAASSALGALSPLVGGVLRFFGFESRASASEVFAQQKGEEVARKTTSIDKLQSTFNQLIESRAKGHLVCVFVDDLDRCMPDVALDILEAIKFYLSDLKCVFIVAADERLIGQGLLLRYKDLVETNDDRQVRDFFAQKGREYFEKIIQLSVPLPYHSAHQVHQYLASQFTLWAPATDIIQLAVDDNPRRLGQYCNWLSYRFSVEEKEPGKAP